MAWQIYTAVFLLFVSEVNADHPLNCLTNGTLLVTNPNPELYENFYIRPFKRKNNGNCTGEFTLGTTHVELTNCLPGVAVEVVFTRDRSGLLVKGNYASVMVQCMDIPFFDSLFPVAFKGNQPSATTNKTLAPLVGFMKKATESPVKVTKAPLSTANTKKPLDLVTTTAHVHEQDDVKATTISTVPVKKETTASPKESPLINLLSTKKPRFTWKPRISVSTATPINKDTR